MGDLILILLTWLGWLVAKLLWDWFINPYRCATCGARWRLDDIGKGHTKILLAVLSVGTLLAVSSVRAQDTTALSNDKQIRSPADFPSARRWEGSTFFLVDIHASPEVMSRSVSLLVLDYSTRADADKMYNGKVLYMTGWVYEVGWVMNHLKTTAVWLTGEPKARNSITAELLPSEDSMAALLHKGDVVGVLCLGGGVPKKCRIASVSESSALAIRLGRVSGSVTDLPTGPSLAEERSPVSKDTTTQAPAAPPPKAQAPAASEVASLKRDLFRIIKAELQFAQTNGDFAFNLRLLRPILRDSIARGARFSLDGYNADYVLENDVDVALSRARDPDTGEDLLSVKIVHRGAHGGYVRCLAVVDMEMNGTPPRCSGPPPWER